MIQEPKSPDTSEEIRTELERRDYYLSTLFDISRDIFGTLDPEAILRNFLLMTMGNFGVVEGFILIVDLVSGKTEYFVHAGGRSADLAHVQERARAVLLQGKSFGSLEQSLEGDLFGLLPSDVVCALPFVVDAHSVGLLGLGAKILSQPYDEEEARLLTTLVNSMVIALQNARSFEEVKRLNIDLLAKHRELEKTLGDLQSAVRKVEILEGIKASLSKFVPSAVTRSIESGETASIPDAKVQDVSVLFLDVEGYTEISQRLSIAELNDIIERYFSVFLEAIYKNNGDVNETAGDSLMVLFMNESREANALEAARTALTIRGKANGIECGTVSLDKPLTINMGINSGEALVGAARFESYTGFGVDNL